jgi:hypothetical protein
MKKQLCNLGASEATERSLEVIHHVNVSLMMCVKVAQIQAILSVRNKRF